MNIFAGAANSQMQREMKICKRLTVLTKVTKRILNDIDVDGNLLDDLIQRRPKRFNPQAIILETIDILQSREKSGTEIMLKLSEPSSPIGTSNNSPFVPPSYLRMNQKSESLPQFLMGDAIRL